MYNAIIHANTPSSMLLSSKRQCREMRCGGSSRAVFYKILQVLFLIFLRSFTAALLPLLPPRSKLSSSTWIAVLMASSKTSATPICSFAEHSIYLAPILFATAWPCSGVTGVRPCVRRSSIHVRLFRRSDLRPTRTSGVVGQKCRTSGYHCESQLTKATVL